MKEEKKKSDAPRSRHTHTRYCPPLLTEEKRGEERRRFPRQADPSRLKLETDTSRVLLAT